MYLALAKCHSNRQIESYRSDLLADPARADPWANCRSSVTCTPQSLAADHGYPAKQFCNCIHSQRSEGAQANTLRNVFVSSGETRSGLVRTGCLCHYLHVLKPESGLGLGSETRSPVSDRVRANHPIHRTKSSVRR